MQMFRPPFAIAAILVTLSASISQAQAQPGEEKPRGMPNSAAAPNVDELVRLALQRSPSLAAARARQASAREQVEPAAALPDPMVGVMYQSIGAPWQPMAPMSMLQLEVTQAIPGFGKRSARRAAASAEAESRTHGIRAMRARIAADVRRTFAQIYVIDREHETLLAAKDLANVFETSVVGRYTSGQLDQEALVKAQLAISELESQLADHDVERQVLVATLNNLIAAPQPSELPKLTALPDVDIKDVASVSRVAGSTSPELHAQHAAIEAASRRVDAAQKDTRPNFVVGLAGGSTTGADPVVVLRFGMELPLWSGSKQEPMVRAARSDLEAAHGELKMAELQLREQTDRLLAQWQRDSDQIRRYRDVIVPQTNLALRAAQASYSSGKADFGTLIDDFQRWLDAQVSLIRRQADRYVTWAELQSIINPEP